MKSLQSAIKLKGQPFFPKQQSYRVSFSSTINKIKSNSNFSRDNLKRSAKMKPFQNQNPSKMRIY